MKIETTGRVLSAAEKPYTIEGRSGLSYKVRVLIGAYIYPLKTDSAGVEKAKVFIDKEANVSIEVVAPAEKLNLALVDISAIKKA